jgi:hypothetical protein
MLTIRHYLFLLFFPAVLSAADFSYYFTFNSKLKAPLVEVAAHLAGKTVRFSPTKARLYQLFKENPRAKKAFIDRFGRKGLLSLSLISNRDKLYRYNFDVIGLLDDYSGKLQRDTHKCLTLDTELNTESTPWSVPPSPPLIVESGQTKVIWPGSILHYESLLIKPGGLLKINNGGSGATYLKFSGDCHINGTLESIELLSNLVFA